MMRRIVENNLPWIQEIERKSFPKPWEREDFLAFIDGPPNLRLRGPVDESGRLAGYVAYELSRPTLRIHNLAVAQEYRRQGYGREILRSLHGDLWAAKCDRILIDVSETNLDAHLFLRAAGYVCTRINRNYYQDGGSAYAFEWHLPTRERREFRRIMDRIMGATD